MTKNPIPHIYSVRHMIMLITWQFKIPSLTRNYILKQSIFNCHVVLSLCTYTLEMEALRRDYLPVPKSSLKGTSRSSGPRREVFQRAFQRIPGTIQLCRDENRLLKSKDLVQESQKKKPSGKEQALENGNNKNSGYMSNLFDWRLCQRPLSYKKLQGSIQSSVVGSF